VNWTCFHHYVSDLPDVGRREVPFCPAKVGLSPVQLEMPHQKKRMMLAISDDKEYLADFQAFIGSRPLIAQRQRPTGCAACVSTVACLHKRSPGYNRDLRWKPSISFSRIGIQIGEQLGVRKEILAAYPIYTLRTIGASKSVLLALPLEDVSLWALQVSVSCI
jgi:hypothetical protein